VGITRLPGGPRGIERARTIHSLSVLTVALRGFIAAAQRAGSNLKITGIFVEADLDFS